MPTLLVLKTILEVTVLGFILFRLILLARETRAYRLLRGLGVILLLWGGTILFDLGVLRVILDGVDMPTVIVVTLLVLFTPEIKEALARLGGRAPFGHSPEERQFLTEIVNACDRMAQSKTGALIVLQRADGLADVIGTGVQLNAEVTSAFIEQVFYKDTPLHDGALIIAKRRCAAARCRLPNSSQLDLQDSSTPLGLRHRAGLGLAEVRDAVTVIVSEERGQISYCERGTLERNLSPERLRELLTDAFTAGQDLTESPWGERIKAALTTNLKTKAAAFGLAAAIWCLNAQTIETHYRIDFRPPVPSDYPPDLVLITNQADLHVHNARIRGGNLDLLKLLIGQTLDPDHMRSRFEIDLTGSAIESESDHWKEVCRVHDLQGRVELVNARPRDPIVRRRNLEEDPLTVVVKMDVLEKLELENPYLIAIRTVGTLPQHYKTKGTPFLEHSGVTLRFRKGNRKILESQLKLPQELVQPLDLTGRRESLQNVPVRVRLPASPPEVRELYRRLYRRNYFDASLTYSIMSDKHEADPLARRKAEVVKLEQESVARKKDFEEQSQRLEAARQRLLSETDRGAVTLQGYATVLADRETARAREKLTAKQLVDAKLARDDVAKQTPADPISLRLEKDAVQAIARDLGYQSDLVKLHSRLVKAYTERIQPVLDLQQETEALLAAGWEPSEGPPPAGSIPALEAQLGGLDDERANPRNALTDGERKRFESERRRLVEWTAQGDRLKTLGATIGSLLQLDPLNAEFAKQVPAHQGRVQRLMIELKELRGQLEALWLREERIESERFPALARARQIYGQTKARVKRLQARITLRELELERRHLLAWIGELKSKVEPGRKTLIASAYFLADEADRTPAVLDQLRAALTRQQLAQLSEQLADEQVRTASLIESVGDLEAELAAIQRQVAQRRRQLDREHVFLALRMERPEVYLLPELTAKQREAFYAPLEGTEEAELKRLTGALSEDRVENRDELRRQLTYFALRVGKAQARQYLLPDLSAEENQLLDTPPNVAQLRVLIQRLGEIEGEADGDVEFERDKLYTPLAEAVSSSHVSDGSLPVLLGSYRDTLLAYQAVLGDEASGVQQLLARLAQALAPKPAPPTATPEPDGSK